MRICTCPSSASALGKVLARIRCAVCASVVTFGTLSRPGRAFGSWRGERVCLQGFVCKFNPSDCLSLACCSFFGHCARAHNFRLLSVFSFLVECFAAKLLGSATMGRKYRNSQNLQSLSISALLEVNAQLKLQNQELMGLLATQQSSRDPGRTRVVSKRQRNSSMWWILHL